jgi:chaperonin GroES
MGRVLTIRRRGRVGPGIDASDADINTGAGLNSPPITAKLERRSSMNIRPLHDRIIVERLEEETKTAGGLIIPDTAKEKPQQGKVIAVGKGKKTEDGKILPLDVKVGDKILFGKYAGTEIKIEGQEFLMMREDDVLGVVEGGKKK